MCLQVLACVSSGPPAPARFGNPGLAYEAHDSTTGAVVLVTPTAAWVKGEVLASPISLADNVDVGPKVIEVPFAPLLACIGAPHIRPPVDQALVPRSKSDPSEFDRSKVLGLEGVVGRDIDRSLVGRQKGAHSAHGSERLVLLGGLYSYVRGGGCEV